MDQLELSMMPYGSAAETAIRLLLDQFEAEYRCHVRIRTTSWETGRQESVSAALSGKGPDVSVVGTTWCPGLASMQVLRPFTPREIESFGGVSAFFPPAWESGKVLGDQRMWAIPWTTDMRPIVYRRDLLERAGIAVKQAFLSPAQLLETLRQLQGCGISTPFALASRGSIYPLLHLHNLASFVWGAGGEFLSRDGTRTMFHLPETRLGIRNFLKLSQYLSTEARGLDIFEANALFWQGRAAVTFSLELPFKETLEKIAAPPEVMSNLGVATMPGTTFVGGCNLVMWRNVPLARENLALELIRFLSGQKVQRALAVPMNFLPARTDVLQASPFNTEPFCQVLTHGLETGRSFPAIPRWGLVEDQIMQVLAQLWENALAHPEQNVDLLITELLEPIAQRLDLILRSG